ncbi:phosphate signaling complex protein PhoU [candidate division WOR-3 bacterium]|nr:phosphate signaling complex protein PhoU [candidate division WOR-3 bacterium]
MLHEKIEQLKENIISFSSLIEDMIVKSLNGLMSGDSMVLDEVIGKLENEANRKEVEIEKFCTHIVAQFGPKASDLRKVLMILEMNSDLERMGDHAVNIAQHSLFLIEKPKVKEYADLVKMKDDVLKMFKESIVSFIKEDIALAREVCANDDVVDDLKDSIIRELVVFMLADATTIERALKLINITHDLERIADLTTNIAEDVVFIGAGKTIKHNL